MLINLTKQDKDGTICEAAVNPRYITSAIYVPSMGLTALNMYQQHTLWVTEGPDEISRLVYEGEQ